MKLKSIPVLFLCPTFRSMNTIANIRREYILQTLDEREVHADPIIQFNVWWEQATKSEIDEPNAMTLATADLNGRPSARIVLLKGILENGFVFFTNYQSQKGIEMDQNPSVSLVFFWKELERQVRIVGTVTKTSPVESDSYFASRPMVSKLGAWASSQSSIIPSRKVLEENMAALVRKYPGNDVPRPPYWGGYIVKPMQIEFWQGRPGRLHDRICYTSTEKGWQIDRLAP